MVLQSPLHRVGADRKMLLLPVARVYNFNYELDVPYEFYMTEQIYS